MRHVGVVFRVQVVVVDVREPIRQLLDAPLVGMERIEVLMKVGSWKRRRVRSGMRSNRGGESGRVRGGS